MLTGSGILCGIACRAILYGVQGVIQGILSCTIVIVTMFVLFVIHVLGAGDIKLLAAVGAFVGFGIGEVLVDTCICTGIFGVGKLVFERLKNDKHAFGKTRMHMSIPIACGSVIFMAGGW